MKTKILLALMAISATLFAQTNYFQWKTESLLPTYYPYATGKGLVVDQYENVFYTISYPTYDRICMIDKSSNSFDRFDESVFKKVMKNSSLAYGDHKVFFFDQQGEVNAAYKYNGSYRSGTLDYNFPNGRGKGILFTNPSILYYVTTTGDICKLQFYSGAWHAETISLSEKVHADCDLAYNNNKLYYIGVNGNIIELYKYYTSWIKNTINSGTNTKARGDALIVRNKIIYYTSSTYSGAIMTLTNYDNRGFKFAGRIWEAVPSNGGTNFIKGDYIDGINYVGTDETIHSLYYENCKWNNYKIDVNIDPKSNSRIVYNQNSIYAVSAVSNKIGKISPFIDPTTNKFIYLKGGTFMNKNEEFKPIIAMNYSVSVVHNLNDYNNIWAIPVVNQTISHNPQSNFADGIKAIDTDFKKLYALGFNTIRLCGFPAFNVKNELVFKTHIYSDLADDFKPILGDANAAFRSKVFWLLSQVMYKAHMNELKVILCTGAAPQLLISKQYEEYLSLLAEYFKFDEKILAYDVCNEPNYLLSERWPDQTKETYTCRITDWINSIRNIDNNHLITFNPIGSFDVIFNFDYKIIPVDFISFHIYPYKSYRDYVNKYTVQDDLELFRVHMKWIKNVVDIPWIIGETGFSSFLTTTACYYDLDEYSICEFGPISEQTEWVDKTIKETFQAGGKGYSYWNFRDLRGARYDTAGKPNLDLCMGLYTLCNASGDYTEAKPAAALISTATDKTCNLQIVEPNDYYFHKGEYNLPESYTGTIKNKKTGAYIKDAIIRIYDGKTNTSFSDENGFFKVKCKTKGNYSLFTSAYGMSYYSTNTGSTTDFQIYLSPIVPCSTTKSLKSSTGFKNNSDDNQFMNESIENRLEVYPNPSTGEFNISIANSGNICHLEVYNHLGMIILNTNIDANNSTINLTEYPKGLFVFKVTDDNNIYYKKVITK